MPRGGAVSEDSGSKSWRVAGDAARFQREDFQGKRGGFHSSHLTSLTPSPVPPTRRTLETAFLEVTIEHYVPVSAVSVPSLSHRPSRPAPNPGEHSHPLENLALFGFPLQAPLPAGISVSVGLQFRTSLRALQVLGVTPEGILSRGVLADCSVTGPKVCMRSAFPSMSFSCPRGVGKGQWAQQGA